MATMFFSGKPTTLRQWETRTKAVLVLNGVLAVVYVLVAVVIGVTGKLSGAERVALLLLSLVSVPIWSGWLNQTRLLLLSFGADARRVGRHWSNAVSFALVVAAYVVFFLDRSSLIFPALLAVSTAPAMLGVVNIRALVRGVAGGEIAPQAPDNKPPPPAVDNGFW